MPIQDEQPQVLRPAVWPDDKKLFYWIIAGELAGLSASLFFHNVSLAFFFAVLIGLLPGMPLFFHAVFHFLVTVRVWGNNLSVTSYVPGAYVKTPRYQEASFSDIDYVYYLEREIELLKRLCRRFKGVRGLSTETDFTFGNLSKKYGVTRDEFDGCLHSERDLIAEVSPAGFEVFLRTKLDMKAYLRAERTSAGGFAATARAKACLVLSNGDGSRKTYLPNFYDLSGRDSRGFLQTLKEKNPRTRFLMDVSKVRRLVRIGKS
jgi:hypothetical protein